MTVLLNKWNGQQFEHNNIRCDFCRRHGAVKEFTAGDCIVRICKGCLLVMVAEIDQIVLAGACNMNIKSSPEEKIRLELKYGSPIF
jgi:hypothetical protein